MKQLVLLGGGHSQIEVLRKWAMAPLPDVALTLVTRDLLASYSGITGDLAQATSIDWDLELVNPRNGNREALPTVNTVGAQEVEAVLGFKFLPRELFENRRQLVAPQGGRQRRAI